MATLAIAPNITTHEPPSRQLEPSNAKPEHRIVIRALGGLGGLGF